MKILILADKESRKIWDFYEPGMLNQYDLILSAGDLSPHYLEFVVTMGNKPLYYVHGNHDDCYEETPPGGCVCIDGRVAEFRGLRILGLGGSMRYKNGKNMYTPLILTFPIIDDISFSSITSWIIHFSEKCSTSRTFSASWLRHSADTCAGGRPE